MIDKDNILRFSEYIKENSELTTEIEIREFLKQEVETNFREIFNKTSDRFSMDNIYLDYEESNQDENFQKIKEIKNELIETIIDIVIDNIKDFNKTWEKPEDSIDVGDTVISIETGKEYFVSRFGSNNNFYDNNKKVFIDLDTVKKKLKDID